MPEAPTSEQIAQWLTPYRIGLTVAAVERLRQYLNLLIRWNQRMNLTAVRDPRSMVTQLFGESLFLASLVPLEGHLVDAGSGAGFPGLALKLAAPGLRVTLIDSNRKKATFLKEVVRQCGFEEVEVVNQRMESWAGTAVGVDLITTRAVTKDARTLEWMARILRPGGRCVLFVTVDVVSEIAGVSSLFQFSDPVRLPESDRRSILIGRKI